jgi:hypothetical protein
VYVDGYYAGTVDDFDGFAQRLHLPPGEHELELYLEGYRATREKLRLGPGATYRIKYAMQRLEPGDEPAERPKPTEPPQPARSTPAPPPEASAPSEPAESYEKKSGFGTLSMRVQPAGAAVLVDGERWEGPEGQDRLVIQLSEGTHRIEVQSTGYRSYSGEVKVTGGEVTTLNVSLPAEDRR